MTITTLTPATLTGAAALAAQVYESDAAALLPELAQALDDPQQAIYVALDGAEAIGFAQASLRHDYVEGTETSPVGYLEGVCVAASHRRRGVGRQLAQACKDWARTQGCTEFASDTQLGNTAGQAFHRALGFAETGRIVCYRQKL